MYSEPDSQCEPFVSLQACIEVSHCSKNSQTSPYCSLGVIFVSLGIAKINEESIPKELGDMSIKACDDLRTGSLICTYHVSILFRIELRCKFGGFHQITEHY